MYLKYIYIKFIKREYIYKASDIYTSDIYIYTRIYHKRKKIYMVVPLPTHCLCVLTRLIFRNFVLIPINK